MERGDGNADDDTLGDDEYEDENEYTLHIYK